MKFVSVLCFRVTYTWNPYFAGLPVVGRTGTPRPESPRTGSWPLGAPGSFPEPQPHATYQYQTTTTQGNLIHVMLCRIIITQEK